MGIISHINDNYNVALGFLSAKTKFNTCNEYNCVPVYNILYGLQCAHSKDMPLTLSLVLFTNY